MANETSKSSKKKGNKSPMDSEVTRVVLIFMLLLVIVVLLIAAFMSLGNGAETTNKENILTPSIDAQMTDENGETLSARPAETTSPNHGNTETEPIPDEVLNPDAATTQESSAIETAPIMTVMTETTAAQYTTTGTRPANTNPVYIATSDLATLAPPLTTASDDTGNTTLTETVEGAEAGETVSVNYTVQLSGSSSIYSDPNGSSSGTVGSAGTFTIVQETTDSNGVKWGKLKSGAGWVRLN